MIVNNGAVQFVSQYLNDKFIWWKWIPVEEYCLNTLDVAAGSTTIADTNASAHSSPVTSGPAVSQPVRMQQRLDQQMLMLKPNDARIA